ncbi:hypothetical protein NQ317_004776 [Molorchus minor]|uniref:Integrase catalytic domain-containing protein n=1 Tax=Molorchus minor TaxID=1323400 RepID=A0ABQ9JJN4_9CUCU|nr:hypothetical protein NQ317_004776 [Molorchus minor]
MANTIPPLEPLDCEGDPASLGIRALLLHSGGIALQEIFYNLPGANVDSPSEENINIFEIALEKLDEFFAPKQSVIYERHIFRLIKQEENEKFDKFLLKLRHQATKCKFRDLDGNLIDQIVEKCSSRELRKKILALGDEATLDKIVKEANALEAVNRQMEKFEAKSSTTYHEAPKYKKGRADKNSSTSNSKEEVNYIFHLDSDTTLRCEIGGVKMTMIIDSGSKNNIVDDKTWEYLKRERIIVKDQRKSPEKKFMSYANKIPLTTLGSFKAEIKIGDRREMAIFYVIKNGGKCLLGKDTAMTLGVLKIGVNINSVDIEPFPKFKNIVRRELPSKPWIDVAIDFMGPLPNGEYIFVIIDYYSRYKEIKIMRSITSSSTIEVLREIFSRLGLPESITADNGRQFCSNDFTLFCKENNIILYHTIPYWPQQNGEVERQNRSILKRIKISQSTGRNWKHDLTDYLTMYNSTPHCTTGKTPSELFFGRQFRDKLPSIPNIPQTCIDEEVKDRDKLEKAKGKENADRKRRAVESSIDYEHTVVEKEGGDITVKNNDTGEEYRKNIVHLKKDRRTVDSLQ